MLAYATATNEKVVSCILCSPLALYIHPVEFVTVSPAFSSAPAFFVCLISFSFVSIFHFKSSQTLFFFYPYMSDNPQPFFLSLSLFNKMHLKRPEILCDILLSPCFVLLRGSRGGRSPFISAPPGGEGGSGGGEDVCSYTPLVSHTQTHTQPFLPLFFFGNSPESWLE